MTTATLSTRATIPPTRAVSELEVDYDYDPKTRELQIESVVVSGHAWQVWEMLSPLDRERIRDECVTDYYDRMEQDPGRVRGQRG